MKVAFCLHGLAGGKNDKGEPVEWNKIAYPLFKTHILDKNNADVFIHSWTVDLKDELVQLYKPRKYIFEQQIMFDKAATYKHSIYSRWYSLKKVVELKQKYELENNFKYDCVMITRFDLGFYRDVNFNEFDMNYFYAPTWEESICWREGIEDLWFFSNSEFIDKFSTLYDYLDQYFLINPNPSNHWLAKHHLEKLELFKKTKYIFRNPKDFILLRKKYAPFSYKLKIITKKMISRSFRKIFGDEFYIFLHDRLTKIIHISLRDKIWP